MYSVFFLGEPDKSLISEVSSGIKKHVSAFGLTVGREIQIFSGKKPLDLAGELAGVVVFVGSKDVVNDDISYLTKLSIPTIIAASGEEAIFREIPEDLRHINACFYSPDQRERLVTTILRQIGLLPEQRNIFLSYKRSESRAVAVQLFDRLSAKKYGVFLDTHGIQEGDIFQEQLWHKLIDCDVVVMLDTPSYYDSRWTREELARANQLQLSILRLEWPDVDRGAKASLFTRIKLSEDNFDRENLRNPILDNVVNMLELERSKSVARRHHELISQFRAIIERDPEMTARISGPDRCIEVETTKGNRFLAKPVAGIPTARHVQAMQQEHSSQAKPFSHHYLLCREVGIETEWLKHLEWLQEKITDVKIGTPDQLAWHIPGEDQ